ncbi:putative HNHc nuclease [Caloranaerobacter ferrireducens]|uniref:putative HNHc nuclease n=1 Tax=Caloranaerobacter ferrireducens TaxID=1323370 RepID=UPI00084D2EF1|nr:putative HNHc nuclease [Caloranaerobacter ferrireducens]
MRINCEIDNIKTLKKGMKITLAIGDKEVPRVMKNIYNFMDKPITIDFLIDEQKQIERMKQITPEQRKKIYAMIRDIANCFGENEENTKENLKIEFIQNSQYEDFSLSNCSKELAGDFIDFLINFAFENGIPMTEHPIKRVDDLDRYLKACLRHRICAICGRRGEIHHVDTIGMGNDRNKVNDRDYRKMCLCRVHHTEYHTLGAESFYKKYHLHGVIYEE